MLSRSYSLRAGFSAIFACVTVFSALGGVGPVTAQSFPDKPVRMIVPYPAGGPTDLLARKVAASMEKPLGATIIVDNRGGANGVIGTEAVARSDADGYTILMTGMEQHVGNKLMFANVKYDPIKDFQPITQINAEPLVLVVNPSLPVNNVSELVALAKSKPGTLNFASSSVGSLSHFAGEMLKQIAGIDIVHVPYKGGGPAMLDVLSGQVPIYFSGVNAALGYIQSGKLRALGVTSKDRVSILADVPPLAETPELKNYEASIKFALWGPAKMPAKIIEKLNASAVTGLRSPEIQEYLKRQGSSPAVANTPQEMAADLVTIEKTLPLMFEAAGIKQQ